MGATEQTGLGKVYWLARVVFHLRARTKSVTATLVVSGADAEEAPCRIAGRARTSRRGANADETPCRIAGRKGTHRESIQRLRIFSDLHRSKQCVLRN